MAVDNLLYEKVLIIKYETSSSKGMMIVLYSYYMKKINKFKKALKDCNIYYMCECVLTPEILKELNL